MYTETYQIKMLQTSLRHVVLLDLKITSFSKGHLLYKDNEMIHIPYVPLFSAANSFCANFEYYTEQFLLVYISNCLCAAMD